LESPLYSFFFGILLVFIPLRLSSLFYTNSSPSLFISQLPEKGKNFKWAKKFENSFQEPKKRLTSTLVLAFPNPNEKFVIFCYVFQM